MGPSALDDVRCRQPWWSDVLPARRRSRVASVVPCRGTWPGTPVPSECPDDRGSERYRSKQIDDTGVRCDRSTTDNVARAVRTLSGANRPLRLPTSNFLSLRVTGPSRQGRDGAKKVTGRSGDAGAAPGGGTDQCRDLPCDRWRPGSRRPPPWRHRCNGPGRWAHGHRGPGASASARRPPSAKRSRWRRICDPSPHHAVIAGPARGPGRRR